MSKKQVGWKLEPLIIEQLRTLAIRKSPQLDMDVLIDKKSEQLNNIYCLESSKNKTLSNFEENSSLLLIDEKDMPNRLQNKLFIRILNSNPKLKQILKR